MSREIGSRLHDVFNMWQNYIAPLLGVATERAMQDMDVNEALDLQEGIAKIMSRLDSIRRDLKEQLVKDGGYLPPMFSLKEHSVGLTKFDDEVVLFVDDKPMLKIVEEEGQILAHALPVG